MKTSLDNHRLLIEALRERNPEKAERRMRQHLRHVRDGVMENIKFFLTDEGTGTRVEQK
jgi:DNA-binding GntR family transcriptional regulator